MRIGRTEFWAFLAVVGVVWGATITSEGRGTVSAENGLFFKDGKIFRHIALTLLPNTDYEKLGTIWK